MLSHQRIIVAVDVDHPAKGLAIVEKLKEEVGLFKIGLELITAMLASVAVGSEQEAAQNLVLVRKFFALLGHQFFWDGKWHDIANTVGAVAKIVGGSIKAGMINVHASGGIEQMMAAVANKGSSRVLAVTVTTSREENEGCLDYGAPLKARVLSLARNAKLAKCDGVICSPQELALLNNRPELAGLLKVTPGIRSPEDPPDDQRRTLSPRQAGREGADFMVIGRPITTAKDPVEATRRIAAEFAKGLCERLHLALFGLQKVKFGAFKLKLHEKNPDAPLSPIYLNIRDCPDWLYGLMGDVLHDLIMRENVPEFDYVIGIPKAGEPIGIALAKAVGKPHLRMKKEESEGGRRITSTILDPFEEGKRVLLVDDLVTGADTKREAIESVEENDLEVVATMVLYDREQGGLKTLNAEGRKMYAVATLSDALDLFVNEKKISAEKKQAVLDYIAAN